MPTTPNYFVRSGQTLLDICLESAGEIDGLFTVAQENGIGITDDLAVGAAVLGIAPALTKLGIVALFLKNPPASGTTIEQTLPGGIGYMQIGTSFIVS